MDRHLSDTPQIVNRIKMGRGSQCQRHDWSDEPTRKIDFNSKLEQNSKYTSKFVIYGVYITHLPSIFMAVHMVSKLQVQITFNNLGVK